jgi:adenylate kinase
MSLVVFLGAPGSGKGTQAQLLSSEYPESVIHVSTGQLLRDYIKHGSERALQLKKIVDSGKLIPDEEIFIVLEENLKSYDQENIIILDGFPRTLNQGLLLNEFAKKTGNKIKRVVYFDIIDEELVNRLSGRYICTQCCAVYHKLNKLPQQLGVCDSCGSTEFQVREDDKEDVVLKRLGIFHKETEPLVSYYEAEQILTHVYVNRNVDDIKIELLKLLSL